MKESKNISKLKFYCGGRCSKLHINNVVGQCAKLRDCFHDTGLGYYTRVNWAPESKTWEDMMIWSRSKFQTLWCTKTLVKVNNVVETILGPLT